MTLMACWDTSDSTSQGAEYGRNHGRKDGMNREVDTKLMADLFGIAGL